MTNIFISMRYITIIISFNFKIFFSVKCQHFAKRHRVILWKYFHLSIMIMWIPDKFHWIILYICNAKITYSYSRREHSTL
uniref:Uncharacterized protein n=1 Tax=Panstrongylus lignarius TaxID=156445 RepID=A0A224Y3A1_9HEMI